MNSGAYARELAFARRVDELFLLRACDEHKPCAGFRVAGCIMMLKGNSKALAQEGEVGLRQSPEPLGHLHSALKPLCGLWKVGRSTASMEYAAIKRSVVRDEVSCPF